MRSVVQLLWHEHGAGLRSGLPADFVFPFRPRFPTFPRDPSCGPRDVSPLSMRCYIGLGSNLGDRAASIAQAHASLRDLDPAARLSSIWESAPMYVSDQPRFLNAVAAIETSLDPAGVLEILLRTERRLGRTRSVRFGPRTIDLDLLACDEFVIDSERLTLPHPRMHERPFVLMPLAQLAPNWRHPRSGTEVRRLIEAVVPVRGMREWTVADPHSGVVAP